MAVLAKEKGIRTFYMQCQHYTHHIAATSIYLFCVFITIISFFIGPNADTEVRL